MPPELSRWCAAALANVPPMDLGEFFALRARVGTADSLDDLSAKDRDLLLLAAAGTPPPVESS